jgi:hypothetical protein
MPITVEMMKAAARAGMSIVCASCELYWQARERGVPGDQCLAKDNCGSPLVGDCFHEYRGIMTSDAFKRFCFVCGTDSTHRLNHPNWIRSMSMCREHVEWMKDPEMRRPTPAGIPQKVNGQELPPENTLLGQILKTEKEWADEGDYEFEPQKIIEDLSGGKEPDVEGLDDGEPDV